VVTVAELLDDPELALHPVVVPYPDQQIRWVATSELPDPTPFFQGGEVLLTTGLQTRTWTSEWVSYVSALADSGTVALGLATGLTYETSPAALVDACTTAGMNLFEVPRHTPFVALSHRVSRLLAAEEEASARQTLVIQRPASRNSGVSSASKKALTSSVNALSASDQLMSMAAYQHF